MARRSCALSGDTKRPLLFLVIAGVINACLNMVLVIVFKLGVAGVAIATVISQMISCVLVLRCLCQSKTSYRLRFSELGMKGYYLKQIFFGRRSGGNPEHGH